MKQNPLKIYTLIMSISLLVKPVSGACNLNCEYCFYKEFFKNRKGPSLIDSNYLANFILNIQTYKTNVDIAFQGGEPLLAGIDFYKDLFSKINLDHTSLSIQTNATLINDEWCELFKKYNILVGISLDGNNQDNKLRVYQNDKDSYGDIINSISLLKKHKINHNIVCVVSKNNINSLNTIFDFFKNDLKENYLQFIPCLKTSTKDLSLSNEEYYNYLQILFDKYYDGIINNNYISIRYFDELINIINGLNSTQCGMNGRCEKQLVIESDGSTYPCDFYCDDNHLLGNIKVNTYKELVLSSISDNFTKKEVLDKCKTCKYYKLCQGGCKRQRQDHDYCESIYKFLDKNINKLIYISHFFKGK